MQHDTLNWILDRKNSVIRKVENSNKVYRLLNIMSILILNGFNNCTSGFNNCTIVIKDVKFRGTE